MAIYTPPNYGAQYPGSPIYGQPPAVGRANYTPITPPAATAPATTSGPLNPPANLIGHAVKVANTTTQTQVAPTINTPDPKTAPIGIPNQTPLLTPIGTAPHYTTPSEIWEYDYGNGGAGNGNGGNWA